MILTKSPNQKQKVLPIEVKNKIVEAIHGLRFGTVNIIVQDGYVIQIEKLEKERVK
ncbi:MAG: YezD family protein [Syntrophomonas sp.]